MVKMYLVGGFVRDRLMGVASKDMDFAVEAESFAEMHREIMRRGGKIYLETPEYLTIRAKVPEWGDADFVLCRKDGEYVDGRHPETVEIGTLHDDLARRDFTMNAIAMAEDGDYIDPFDGQKDIQEGVIRCVGSARERFQEDYLRMLRAIRFAITKDMLLSADISDCLEDEAMVGKLLSVSVERIREELHRCFMFNTAATLWMLDEYRLIRDVIFKQTDLRLKPTLER